MAQHRSIPIDKFDVEIKSRYVEVSTSAFGGKVLSCSDDFFVSRHNLIKASPSVSMKGQFGPNGALYDAWETRRHNPEYDWIIIKLAPHLSSLHYVDIDTSHFSGNEAPMSQVFALTLDEPLVDPRLSHKDPRWTEILPTVELGPNSRHIFQLGQVASQGHWSAVMVRMIPDGGMARFRAYGTPLPPAVTTLPLSPADMSSFETINLLDPVLGARIISCSDANFSPPGNLLLPTRGFDMSDGWETRRSQHNRGKYAPGQPLHGQERCEWVIARLACLGVIRYVEVDTAYHPGNYPTACVVEALLSDENTPASSAQWTEIVSRKPLGPHRQHYFDLERHVNPEQVFSHVRLRTFPDGGLKRLRIYGAPRNTPVPETTTPSPLFALPLTYEAFKTFGDMIQGFDLPTSAPKRIDVSTANQGTAMKFHRLGLLGQDADYRIAHLEGEQPIDVGNGSVWSPPNLQRATNSSHTFAPLHRNASDRSTGYVVVVALDDGRGSPDLSTIKAFNATAAQAVSIKKGVWVSGHTPQPLHDELCFGVIASVTAATETSDTALPSVYIPPCQREPTSIASHTTDLPDASAYNESGISVPSSLTARNFAPFGHVIAKGVDAVPIASSYPAAAQAKTALSLFRATPKVAVERGKIFDIKLMERHPYTTQAFIPLGKAQIPDQGESALPAGGQFLVIVAENGFDDRPDPNTLRSFILGDRSGLSYNAGVWHHPVLVLDQALDLLCVETQVSTGVSEEPDERDCQLIELTGSDSFGRVAVPL